MAITSELKLSLDRLGKMLNAYNEMSIIGFLKTKGKTDIIPLLNLVSDHANFLKFKGAVVKYLWTDFLCKMSSKAIKEWFKLLTEAKQPDIRKGALELFPDLLALCDKKFNSRDEIFSCKTIEAGNAEMQKLAEVSAILKEYIQNADAIIGQTEGTKTDLSGEIRRTISSQIKAWLNMKEDIKTLDSEFGSLYAFLLTPYLKSLKVEKCGEFPIVVAGIINGTMDALINKFPVDDIIKYIVSSIIALTPDKTDEQLEDGSIIIAQELVFGMKNYTYNIESCSLGMGRGLSQLTLHGITEKRLAHYKDPYVYNFIKESLFKGAWTATIDIYNSIDTAEKIVPAILKGMELEQKKTIDQLTSIVNKN